MGGPEILLFEALHIIALYPTHNRAYRLVIYAATTYVLVKLILTPDTTNSALTVHTVGCQLAVHFAFTTYLLFAEGSFPDHWRRIRDEDHEGADNLPSNFPLTKKLWWMVDIAFSLRMVGWVHEPRDCLPPPPLPSRRAFLCKASLELIVNAVLLDLLTLVTTQNLAFDSRLHDPSDGPETYLAAVPLLYRAPYVMASGFSFAIGVTMSLNVIGLACVGLGGSSPTLWPDIWGRWRDAYTVRKLWGCVLSTFYFPGPLTRHVVGEHGTKH